jgi:hypothetical protein
MKQRNLTWGCPRIAQQIALAFDIRIDKDVVRRILTARYHPQPDSVGPSWLTLIGHMKDSLWSLGLFRCESATLRTQGRVGRNTSARITIHGIGSTSGKTLRVLEVTEIKTVPYVPLSHPFVERLIGTVRREYLDRTLFWTTADLQTKLLDFQHYYNGHRTHAGLHGRPPEPSVDAARPAASFRSYRWQRHCHGLYQTPIAA